MHFFSDFLCNGLGFCLAAMQGWCSGESTHLPTMWPGFDSQTQCHT